MNDRYEDIPIDPQEAVDLKLHSRNCVRRHVALVRIVQNVNVRLDLMTRQGKNFRIIMILGVGILVAKSLGVPLESLAAVAKVFLP